MTRLGPPASVRTAMLLASVPRGHEHRALLAEQARELGLELFDDTTDRVGVGADAALLGESREQARVLQRREPQPVAAQSNGTLGGVRAPLTRGLLGPDYGWQPETETGGAGRASHEPTPIQRCHAADANRSRHSPHAHPAARPCRPRFSDW